MGKVKTLLVTASCALALLGAGCTGGAGLDQSSAEKAASGFLAAIEAQDKATAKAYVLPESDLAKDFDDGWEDVQKIPLDSFTITGSEEGSVMASLNLKVEGEIKNTTVNVDVKQKDGKWYVTELD